MRDLPPGQARNDKKTESQAGHYAGRKRQRLPPPKGNGKFRLEKKRLIA